MGLRKTASRVEAAKVISDKKRFDLLEKIKTLMKEDVKDYDKIRELLQKFNATFEKRGK